jgi:hypothetical protein
MAKLPGFCGPTYSSQSVIADGERCVNWYPEVIESAGGKNRVVLYPSPGLSNFVTLPDSPVRGLFTQNGRVLAVAGQTFNEIFQNQSSTNYGAVISDGLPVSFAGGDTQVLVASGGACYVFDLTANTLTLIPELSNIAMVGYCDGFFLALTRNSRNFQISALEDATSWDPGDATTVSVFPDNILSMIVDHRQIIFHGLTKNCVYYNAGLTDFPFVPDPSAYIEQGTLSFTSAIRLDNTVMWIGADERGFGIAWRLQGYQPIRISNHAVEYAWSQYSSIGDVIGYAYQDQGHSFAVWYFPSADRTWVYDVATGQWHERGFWNAGMGRYTAHRSQCHVSAFGKHLVGDWSTGNVYQMSINTYDDFGNAIRRLRRTPHLCEEKKRIFYSQIQFDLEAGLGLQSGQGSDPQVMLSWSNDGGKTFGMEWQIPAGMAGEFGRRVIGRRLGSGRDRVFQVSVTDPIPWRLVDVYIEFEVGTN